MSATTQAPRRASSTSTTGWRPDIQGLRAVAVGLVIAAHAGLPFLEGGFVGVDVFFVISGYLITGLLLREHQRTGRISLVDFYVRRARRILPAASVVVCVVLLTAGLTLPRTVVDSTATEGGWSALFLTNWHLAAEGTDYFSSDTPSLLQHYWSLAVEEQFYLVWPLLVLMLLPRLSRKAFTTVTALVFAVSLGWSLLFTALSGVSAYFNTPARAYELAAGALLACFGPGVLRAPYRGVASILGAVLLLVASVRFDAASTFPGWQALVPTIGTALLLSAGPRCLTGRLLSGHGMRWVGDVSFSLYLWHWPALLILPVVLPSSWPSGLVAVLAVVVTVVLAASSYRWIELPFQRRRIGSLTQGRRALLLWPISIAMIVVSAFAAMGLSHHQQQEREQAAQEWFDDDKSSGFTAGDGPPDVDAELGTALRLADQGAPIPPSIDGTQLSEDGWRDLTRDCFAGDGETDAPDCSYGDEGADRVVALVGDSHAAMWLPTLDEIGKERGFEVRLYAKLSCAHYPVQQPAKAMTQEECDAFRSWTTQQLTELEPDTVLLTARGMLFMEERDGVPVPDQWSEAVSRTVGELSTISPDVRVLGDVPTRPDPAECLTAVDATQLGCVVEADGLEAESNTVTQAAVEASGAAQYIDMGHYVCLDGRCPLVVDEHSTYEDDSHIDTEWALHLAPPIAEDLGL